MSNAAIYLHPNGFDTRGARLLGRHSAGESFLRGFLRHAEVDRFYFWNAANRPVAQLQALVDQIQPPPRPATWIPATNRRALAAPGVVNLPGPEISREAWARRLVGAHTYGICAITHTTATELVMRLLGELLIGPTEPYDALICTSSAVRASVETQLDGIRAYLVEAHGPRKRPEPQRATIPLGVNVDDFATSPEQRAAWRERLGIPAEAPVALYVGRFNVKEKMNPALMALALERSAKASGQTIYWVNSGWAETPEAERAYHDNAKALCPSVRYIAVDGRPPETRFSIWSVADFFISFSDNIQETFGLTPVEAMAAGLPCVVSDWDGYKDTVRHGEDGFRIPTYAPAPGNGLDLSYWFSTNRLSYTNYVGAAAQCVAIDLAEAADAITALVLNSELRGKLGAQAKAHARAAFDWSAIVPQYQALWAEQNARRLSEPPAAPDPIHPFSPDPFTLFASYPTHHVTQAWSVALVPGMTWPQAQALLTNPLARDGVFNVPSMAEVEQMLDCLAAQPLMSTAALLDILPQGRRGPAARGLLWLARFGIVTLVPPG